MQSRKNFRYKLHRTPNDTQITQHKLRVAFSYLERNYILNEWEYDLKDYAGRGGLVPGRVVLRISSYRPDRMGPKITPPQKKKKPCVPNFRAINISRGTSRPGYEGTIKNLKIVWIPPSPQKKPYLSQATQKNPEIGNFKPQKILGSSLWLEIRSTPRFPGGWWATEEDNTRSTEICIILQIIRKPDPINVSLFI